MSEYRIAFLGECMIELCETESGLARGFGGDTLNSAIYLSRLQRLVGKEEQKIVVSFLSAMGADSQSQYVLDACLREGVDTSHVVQLDSKLPGIYLIENDPSGERKFHYWRSDSAARFWVQGFEDVALLDHLNQFDAVYLSGISLAIQFDHHRERLILALRRFSEAGGKVVFDTNYRPRLWEDENIARMAFNEVLSFADMALLTFDDEALLFGDMTANDTVERVTALGCQHVVIKCGADSCLVSSQGNVKRIPAMAVEKVIDTTSAGDAFNAGYLLGQTSGFSVGVSATIAHVLASHVIQAKGAIIQHEKMPSFHQLNTIIS
ncbi:sugar kinase [Enterovibrio norvegicus]|uniref:sugar kinase n=1 Tax=Enterovibrio norvegicus TaxID=188144 RepID=UPI0024B2559C|nr:sugar kinase [Enterovibrio norvegicus]